MLDVELKIANSQQSQQNSKESTAQDPLDQHYDRLIEAVREGELVLVLGPGINLPGSRLLAKQLAEKFNYTIKEVYNLAQVSQYVMLMEEPRRLYDQMRQLLGGDRKPTALHEFLAELPRILRVRFAELRRFPIIITTNYDDLLEQAFKKVKQPYHLISYAIKGEPPNRFWYCPPGGANEDWRPILDQNKENIPLDQYPLILKLHGALDRSHSGLVITEDDFINYLSRKGSETASPLPANLVSVLSEANLLFLGYGMDDWSGRVSLHRIWGQRQFQRANNKAWAIDPDCTDPKLEQEFWKTWDVTMLQIGLEDYISELRQRLQARPPNGNSL